MFWSIRKAAAVILKGIRHRSPFCHANFVTVVASIRLGCFDTDQHSVHRLPNPGQSRLLHFEADNRRNQSGTGQLNEVSNGDDMQRK